MQVDSQLTRAGRSHALWFGLAIAATVPAVAVVLAISNTGKDRAAAPKPAAHAVAPAAATPSAAQFAQSFVGLTDLYAVDHGQRARFTRVHCVQAAPGMYMCSYAIARPHRRPECHIMQATWTPDRASSITVTLAGRTRRCRGLHDAIASLR